MHVTKQLHAMQKSLMPWHSTARHALRLWWTGIPTTYWW